MKVAAALLLALAAVAGGAIPARAQAAAPAVKRAEPAKMEEAQARFQRGIELYKEGDFSGALVEFKRAYQLVPSYKILYNLGQVSYQRHDYAAALRYFRRYLGEGDEAIPVERQHEVAGEITRLEPRVGSLEIQTVDEEAEVFVDDVMVGKTPLGAPILVNGGRRKVDVVARSGEHRTRIIDVPGGDLVRLPFPRLVLQPATPAPPRLSAPTVTPPPPAVKPSQNAAWVLEPAVLTAVAAPARKSSFPWKSWTLTALLAGGAATTGALAYLNKRDFDQQLEARPVDVTEVDYYSQRTRQFALATDGLLIGTAIMTAVSFYLTFRDPK